MVYYGTVSHSRGDVTCSEPEGLNICAKRPGFILPQMENDIKRLKRLRLLLAGVREGVDRVSLYSTACP